MVAPQFRTRLRAILLATLVVIGLGTGLLTAQQASAASASAALKLAPAQPTVGAGGTVTLTIETTNLTTRALNGVSVSVAATNAALTREQDVAGWLSGQTSTSATTTLGTASVGAIPAQSSTTTSMSFSASTFPNASSWGTRGLIGQLILGGKTLAAARGSVVYTPGAAPGALTLSTVSPLISTPSALGLMTSNELLTATAPTGYLASALAASIKRTVTLAVDPRITTSIVTLGNAAPASARHWLASLKSATNDGFWLSYADSDLAGQLQAGAATPVVPQITDLPDIAPAPLDATSNWPGWTPSLTQVAWPLADTVAAGNLGTLARLKYEHVVLGSGNVTPSAANAHVAVDKVDSVVTDDYVSGCLARASRAESAIGLDGGSACALSYLAAHLTENGSSSVVTYLDRAVPVSTHETPTEALLGDLLGPSWVKPALLTQVLTEYKSSGHLVSRAESRTRRHAISELIARQTQIESFAPVSNDPATVVNPGNRRLASILSSAWINETTWQIGRAANAALTTETLNSVRPISSSTINMVGGQARIPVVIRNDLDSPVTVIIRAEPSNGRLVVDDTTTLTIEQDSQSRAQIPVTARVGSGSVNLKISLTSRSGTPVGPTQIVAVNVRADWEIWGVVGIAIIFVGLVVAGVIRTLRKRRVRHNG